jgi:adhesin transport system outer membrane protein
MAFACAVGITASAGAVADPKPDSASDPILALGRPTLSTATFANAVSTAVMRHPSLGEAVANEKSAAGAHLEARAALLPTADVSVYSARVLARGFSNDPDTVYERSRANTRTDISASITQTLFDFGATAQRIGGASARLRAAAAGIDIAADQAALRMVAAWYDVFTFRALILLTDQHVARQQGLRRDLQARIERGYSADGDLLRVDSALAQTAARAAGYRRQLANAEARFQELSGALPPLMLERAPPAAPTLASAEMARGAADRLPMVRAAEEQASGANADARAAKADRYPSLSAGVDAGRYGVFEDRRDYDVRAHITVRQRFSMGLIARARQVDAQAEAAAARAQRIREEAERDAAIAWTDVRALDGQIAAQEASYVATRRSREMLAERFRLARGTLFDVLEADEDEFKAATAYIEGLGDRDAAQYALLSRTGRLLDALGIDSVNAAAREGRQ